MIMKYIKTYETKIKYQPKIDDIVLFKDKFATNLKDDQTWNWQYTKHIGKIIDNYNLKYWIILDETNKKIPEFHVPTSRIIRLANQKELEIYNLNTNMNKYNL